MTTATVLVLEKEDAPARRLGPGVVLAGVVLLLAVVAAVVPSLLGAGDPNVTDPANALLPPGSGHPFGTDQLGRDVFSRVVHGARPSLAVGVLATAVGVAGGIGLGVLSVIGGRWFGGLLMRAVDVLQALPEILLALLAVAVLGPGVRNVLLAVGIAAVPSYARLVRAEVLGAVRSDYVEAAVALGRSRSTLIRQHVVPNAVAPLAVLATVGTGGAVLAGSALSFLGLGARPPTAEWGALLSDGQDLVALGWWIAVAPGLAIAAVVVSVTVVGRAVRSRQEGSA